MISRSRSPLSLFLVREFSGMRFVQLMMKLIDHDSGFIQNLSSFRCDPVDSSTSSGYAFQIRFEQASSLHSVQERIQCPRPDAVSMMLELFHHGKSEDLLLRGVNQYVDANESGKEFALVFGHSMPFISG